MKSDDMFCINQQVHSMMGRGQFLANLRSWHLKGSPHWSILHRVLKDASGDVVFELDREPLRDHQRLILEALRLHLKVSQPQKRYEVTVHDSDELGWYQFAINLHGSIHAVAEVSLQPTVLNGEPYGQRNDRQRDTEKLSAASEGGGAEFESEGAESVTQF